MVEEGVRCPICQVVADPLGDHQVGCGGNGDRIHRHDSVRDALFSAAQIAALAPRKEVPSLIPGTSSRPADNAAMMIVGRKDGHRLLGPGAVL